MNINTELIKNKYQEMKSQNKEEEFLDEKLKNIKVFINKKPSHILFNLKIEADDIYIGTN